MSHSNKAAWLDGAGQPYHVADAPLEAPGEGEARVRQQYVSVGSVEKYMQNTFGFANHSPFITGVNIAGVVEEVGPGVTTIQKGQTVFGYAHTFISMADKHGALQLRPIAAVDKLTPLPSSIPLETVAGLPLATAAAGSGLFAQMFSGLEKPQMGQRTDRSSQVVFLTGGSSTVGCMAIQLATLAGYSVVTTCSSHNFDLVKSLGAKAVFDRNSKSCPEECASAITSMGTLKAVFNCTEGPAFHTVIDTLKALGQSDYKFVSAMYPPSDLQGIDYKHLLSLGMFMEGWGTSFWSDFIVPAIDAGELKPAPPNEIVGHSLEDVDSAVKKFGQGVSGKKLLIKLS